MQPHLRSACNMEHTTYNVQHTKLSCAMCSHVCCWHAAGFFMHAARRMLHEARSPLYLGHFMLHGVCAVVRHSHTPPHTHAHACVRFRRSVRLAAVSEGCPCLLMCVCVWGGVCVVPHAAAYKALVAARISAGLRVEVRTDVVAAAVLAAWETCCCGCLNGVAGTAMAAKISHATRDRRHAIGNMKQGS